MSPSPVALSSKTSAPESKQFFLYVFPQEKNSKKKGWSPKLKLSKNEKTTAKNLSCLFFQNKKNSIGPLISTSPYHLQLCCHTVQCFKYAHVCTPYVVKKNKNFFHPKQFVHQCLGFSHLKRKTTKKINKKTNRPSPCFYSDCAINCKNVPF